MTVIREHSNESKRSVESLSPFICVDNNKYHVGYVSDKFEHLMDAITTGIFKINRKTLLYIHCISYFCGLDRKWLICVQNYSISAVECTFKLVLKL